MPYTQKDDLLQYARTSRDTEKTPLINYVIGNSKKKKNLREETWFTRIHWKYGSLEYTGT